MSLSGGYREASFWFRISVLNVVVSEYWHVTNHVRGLTTMELLQLLFVRNAYLTEGFLRKWWLCS
ncbi:hypothetical protein X975_04893, partial [Stegodyphus mimosarum]